MKSKGQKKYKLPLDHLHSALGPSLRDKYFGKIKARILQLGSEKLDLRLTTRQQLDVLLEIEHMLVDEFPKVFNVVHRLRYARQAVVRRHGEQRSRRGFTQKQAEKENTIAVHGDMLDLTKEDSEEELPPRTFPSTPLDDGSARAKPCAVTVQPRRWACSTSTSQTGGSLISSVPTKRPTMALKASASHTIASSPSQVGSLNHIHRFLESCSPSLEYLSSQFVDLGFKSVDLLNKVACDWTRDERRELLKNLRVPEGGVVSELELIALERRFQKYHFELWSTVL